MSKRSCSNCSRRASRHSAIGLSLVRREYPTDIGPVDLLCTDADGRTLVVEVKRVGEIASVEQLLRYQERLDRDTRFAPTLGMLVAQQIKPQAKVFAESKGVHGSRSTSTSSAASTPPQALLTTSSCDNRQ